MARAALQTRKKQWLIGRRTEICGRGSLAGLLAYALFGFVFTATYFAVDYVDWPATRRGYGVRRRAALVRPERLPGRQ